MSNSLWLHRLQHARLPSTSTTPRAYSNLCPSSQWCHPMISSSVIPFSSCVQSFPASGSFPMSPFFTSASASVLPMNIQDWFLLGWTCWISLQSKWLSRVFSNTTVQRINCSALSFLHSPRDSQESSPTPQFKSINSSALSYLYSPTLTSIHDHWKNHSFD